MEDRTTIEDLRLDAAKCLAARDPAVQQRGREFLRMVEVLKVRMLARGVDVSVTSREGATWTRK